MEGSTLVKRLKAASRIQDSIATKLARDIEESFGASKDQNRQRMESIRNALRSSASQVRTILDDLEAFCERRDIEHFVAVLDQMKQSLVLTRLEELEQSMSLQPGVSIAKSEYWADTLDRWADDLVPPASEETKPGAKPARSVPPAIVLEVLRILESQVTLREQTRVAEQGREAMERDAYIAEAIRLSEAEDLLRDRVDIVIDQLESEPQGVVGFAAEIEVLGLASAAMVDAAKTLVSPETGKVAIAAQTEAIELLLRSNKSKADGEGGSGGGAVGSSGGDTSESALRLVGRGLNERAIRRAAETKPTTRRIEQEIPLRWRSGLRRYYDRLEQIESGAARP